MTVLDPFSIAADLLTGTPSEQLLDIASRVLPLYHPRPHTDFLARVLTDAIGQAEKGDDARVLVEMPPGFGKSSVSSIALPCYALSRNPTWEVVLVSAEASLATKWSRDVRRLIGENEIPGVMLSSNSQAMTEWETSSGGSLIARGVGGQITGRRARLMIIDDPVRNLSDAHSKVQRDVLWDTWQSVLKTRLRPGSAVVVVMTRWHEDDLAGRLLASGGWTRVRVPALAEEGDVLGRAVGEPLISPQREETPEQALARWDQTRAEVGPYIWDALYQQRPAPPGGSVFKSDWWNTMAPPATFDRVVTSWDLTFGSETGDYVVGQVWGQVKADLWLLDQVRGRWTFNEQIKQIQALAVRWPDATAHLIEKAAAGGPAIETLNRDVAGLIPIPTNRGSKEIRAIAVAPMVEAGNVHLPAEASWLDEFHSELAGFPKSAPHDDQVDALSQALDWLRVPRSGTVTTNPQSRVASSGGMSLSAMRGRS